MKPPQEVAWPANRAGEALQALARRAALADGRGGLANPPPDLCDRWAKLIHWVEPAARSLGVETVQVSVTRSNSLQVLRDSPPILLPLGYKEELLFLAVLRGGPHRVLVIGPDLEIHPIALSELRDLLSLPLEKELAEQTDRMLELASVPLRSRARARSLILDDTLGSQTLATCLILRLPPETRFFRLVRHARLWRILLAFLVFNALCDSLLVGSWWLLGNGALTGRLDLAWLVAWALMLFSLVPARMLANWLQTSFALGVGGFLKKYLLIGAMNLDPGEIREQGVGQLLGRVIESEAIEALAVNGGLAALSSLVQIVIAGAVLAAGPGLAIYGILLLLWALFTITVGWSSYQKRRRWAKKRFDLTHELVENMVGYRTRMVQEPRACWYAGVDASMASYVDAAKPMDTLTTYFTILIPATWMIAGLSALTPSFVAGSANPASIAVTLGGVLLVGGALSRLVSSLWDLGSSAIAWEQIKQLFHAASRRQPLGTPDVALRFTQDRNPEGTDKLPPVLEAVNLVFRYHNRVQPALRGCSLTIRQGERVLLLGSSGSGKSTLVSVLTAMRNPESGLVLLHGLDLPTVGSEAWRQRAVVVPQFHENHVFSDSFAFNLLMGRNWPPSHKDIEQAEEICLELGLGPLIDRMPGRLWQMVGETGWQLSHGERSRMFVARALLQKADLMFFDESFAALDPETLKNVMASVLKRAPTLVVIAHP